MILESYLTYSRKYIGVLFCLFVLMLSLPAGGETNSSYLLGAGDELKVTVWQEDDLTGIFKVSKDGYLSINWVEPLKVSGLTLDDTKNLVHKTLKQYIRKPVVTISVANHLSKKITVLGEVKKPGQYFLKNDRSLLNILLKEVGGVTSGAGDTISIIRSKGQNGDSNIESENIQVSLSKLLKGEVSEIPVLENGDTIYVASFGNNVGKLGPDGVLVVGQVKNKGHYKVKDGATVLSVIYDAGGFTKFAAKNRVKLFRGTGEEKEIFILRLKDVEKHGDKSKDMALKPGDIVNVPKSRL